MKQGKPKAKSVTLPNAADAKSHHKLQISLAILVALFAFVLYSQSIGYNYTLDDHPAIDQNKLTTQGIAGIPTLLTTDYWYGYKDEFRGAVYRPTSLILFAVVWQFFPNSPHILHFIMVLMFALTCYFLFKTLCAMFKNYNLLFPFICALLFAAHPLHTEVVNSIKSMDEILCLFFSMLALFHIFKYLDGKSIIHLVFSTICFFLSLLSKETGITFLVIIPLAIYFFTNLSLKKNLKIALLFVAITCIYLLLRMYILKDIHPNITYVKNVLNNSLNAAPNYMSQLATTFYIMLRYIFLLIFPHPLSSDHNFAQIKIYTLSDPIALVSILFYIAIGIYAVLNFKKKSLISFAILFYLITIAPVSNIFFLIGTSMAERFVFIPSLGFCILLAYFLLRISKTNVIKTKFKSISTFFSQNAKLFAIVFVILGLYGIKTYSRSKDWKDNLTLFLSAVQISPNSATSNRMYANQLVESVKNSKNNKNLIDTFNIAKHYYKKSLEIYAKQSEPLFKLGVIYYMENNFDSAYFYQKQGIEKKNTDPEDNYNYGKTLNKLLKYDEAIEASNRAIKANPKHEGANFNLAVSYTNKRDYDNGIKYLTKVIELNPKRGEAYYYLGLIFKGKGDAIKSKEYLDKAAALGAASK